MRRKSHYSPYYRSSPWRWWQIFLGFLGSVALLLLLGEILLRLFAGGTLSNAPTLEERYQLTLSTSQGEPIVGSPPHGLKVKLSPILPYELVPNQKSNYWQINSQGFRDNEPVPFAKPLQEVRIFLLGDSAAFGQFAPQNDMTLAHLLEKKLQERVASQRSQPEKFQPPVLPFFFEQVESALALPPRIQERTYRVINAAVPGYTSREQLSLLSHHILQLQPDYLILLGGYADLLAAPSVTDRLDQWLQNPGLLYRKTLQSRLQRIWQNFYVVRFWQKLRQSSAIKPFKPKISANWPDRLQQFRFNLKQMGKLSLGKPFLVIIQPEITGKTSSPIGAEKKILATLGEEYRSVLRQSVGALAPDQLKPDLPQDTLRNYHSIFNQFSQQAFVDPVHFTPEGTKFLVDRIFEEVIKAFILTPELPPS